MKNEFYNVKLKHGIFNKTLFKLKETNNSSDFRFISISWSSFINHLIQVNLLPNRKTVLFPLGGGQNFSFTEFVESRHNLYIFWLLQICSVLVTASSVSDLDHRLALVEVNEAGLRLGVGGVVPCQDGQHRPHSHPPLVLVTSELEIRLVFKFLFEKKQPTL